MPPTPDADPSSPAPAIPRLSDKDGVREYVCSGPLFPQLGLTTAEVTDTRVGAWQSLAAQLCAQLDFDADPAALAPSQAARVYRYYLPVYLWCTARLDAHREAWRRRLNDNETHQPEQQQQQQQTFSSPYSTPEPPPPPPLVIGLSAPQGCGKTTIVTQLQRLLSATNVAATSFSIDDVYLTGAEQDDLAAAHPDNALLRFRGNAGSHDVSLGIDVLRALKNINNENEKNNEKEEDKGGDGDVGGGGGVAVPRYDKTMRGGRGDRAPSSTWPTVRAPLDVVLLEGWMLGFEPVGSDAAAAVDPDLTRVDEALMNDGYDGLHALVDDWMVVRVGDPEWVYKWRLQAEVAARDAGKPTLTDDEVADFVARFMPAYVAYLPRLYDAGPPLGALRGGEEGVVVVAGEGEGGGAGRVLTIRVDAERNVV